ncbi:MAG: hypothetical protein V1773_13300 [bacterium]
MKIKDILIFGLLLIALNTLKAQDEENVGWISKFGAAGGFTPSWILPNYEPINKELNMLGLEIFPKSGMMTYGGSGYLYIMFWENFRIGGTGFGGKISRQKTINGTNIQTDYSIGAGGLTLEYTLPFIHNIAVSVGCILGGGSVDIDIYKNKENFTWDGVWLDNNNSTTINEFKKISNSFYTITPTINVDIPLNRFIALRLGGGYLLEIAGEWKVNNNRELYNTPSDLTANSFFLQTGIFFGFFAF